MIQRDLLKKISAHRGEIYLEALNHDDTFWFKGVKSDVYHTIKTKFPDPEAETGFELDDDGYFGKDYAAV